MLSSRKIEMEEFQVIDLRSDTITQPTFEMREAMLEAEVGDDVYGEDPTVKDLELYAAELFKKEAALFVPTGTMGNLISIMANCWNRGMQILAGDMSHIAVLEQGGYSQIANVPLRSLKNLPDGTFSIEEVEDKITTHLDIHLAYTGVICVENTHNLCGGRVLPLDFLAKVYTLAQSNNILVHMDGARLMNAAVSLGVDVSTITQYCDTVCVCLSKGLGAPVGSVIAGDKGFIYRAKRCRKVLGGSMRQSGILAVSGLLALKTMVNRLSIDHDRAQQIAHAIADLNDYRVEVDPLTVETNIIILKLSPPWNSDNFSRRLMKFDQKEYEKLGVNVKIKISSRDASHARIVLHKDISQEEVDLAIKKIVRVIKSIRL